MREAAKQSVLGRADQSLMFFWIQLSLPTTAHPQHSRPLYIIVDRACLESILKESQNSGVDQKACFQGFQKCTILPSKQAHARSPLGTNFQPPFFCFNGNGLTLNLSGNKRTGVIRTKIRTSTPMLPFWQVCRSKSLSLQSNRLSTTIESPWSERFHCETWIKPFRSAGLCWVYYFAETVICYNNCHTQLLAVTFRDLVSWFFSWGYFA